MYASISAPRPRVSFRKASQPLLYCISVFVVEPDVCCKQGGPSLNTRTGLARLALVCMAHSAPLGMFLGIREKPLWHPGANGTCRAGIFWKMYFSCGRLSLFPIMEVDRRLSQKETSLPNPVCGRVLLGFTQNKVSKDFCGCVFVRNKQPEKSRLYFWVFLLTKPLKTGEASKKTSDPYPNPIDPFWPPDGDVVSLSWAQGAFLRRKTSELHKETGGRRVGDIWAVFQRWSS